ncbi:hypothetical protein IGL98_000950 [Enterococcus sp. DIV0840]|uniref:hypothetical protein n=1 Tax=unclassified Enterococcus TaxID=2608891 RepID=UPI001A90661D|nr:hypothetical protein [Enterococcus sp. DIV0849a]MBO0433652.1 hypothetical protein [Enterococcus sp. DIV0849a]
MQFKSENHLRDYWEIGRERIRRKFLDQSKKEGRSEDDEGVRNFFEFWFSFTFRQDLDHICYLYNKENKYRTTVEVDRYVENNLEPKAEIVWKDYTSKRR